MYRSAINSLFAALLLLFFINGCVTKGTDVNFDSVITIDELKETIPNTVSLLTGGGQTPSIRSDNLNTNFVVFHK